jgi:hypothetical protein
MGQFSWICKNPNCGRDLRPAEYVRIDDHVGVYSGYGVVLMEDSTEWDVFDRKNPNETFTRNPNAWHVSCWTSCVGQDGTDDAAPSERAPEQGFGYAREGFLAPFDLLLPVMQEVGWNIGDDDEVESEEGDDFWNDGDEDDEEWN